MYPSKSDGMFVRESLIFRSDSNGEDLEGYAGAGLYDSITMDTTELRKVDYAADRRAHLSIRFIRVSVSTRHSPLLCTVFPRFCSSWCAAVSQAS